MPNGSDTFTPLSQAEKRDKFLSNIASSKVVPMDKAEKALVPLERLEEVKNLAAIIDLFIP